jgi:dye decolorizing peroxidase
MTEDPPHEMKRRTLLASLVAGAAGVAAGVGVSRLGGAEEPVAPLSNSTRAPREQLHDGVHQPGIHLPHTPQRFGRMRVLDTPAALSELAALSDRIVELTTDGDVALLPDGPNDLTVTVGIGPRIVAAIDPGLPGAEGLPLFAGDDRVDPVAMGGDVLIAAYSSDPTVLAAVVDDLVGRIPRASTRWEQAIFRGVGEGPKARNPLGFFDSVVVPRGDAELNGNVWIADSPLAGATMVVVRRLRLDVGRFRRHSVAEREAIIGRELVSGAPLSGGEPDGQINLNAKTPEGGFLVPADAHARAAHPSFTGSALMLRRSYTFENDVSGDIRDQGLMFVSFQRDLRTFVATQQRLDETDALMSFATPTASGSFLVLPAFSRELPLGAGLS